jgi:hypothetical protein
MPTRYNLSDVDLRKVIAGDALDSAEKKLAAKKVWLLRTCYPRSFGVSCLNSIPFTPD